MKSDLDIAREARLRPILDVATDLGLSPFDVRPYGHDKAKIDLNAAADRPLDGKLILVSAMSPTPAGEGKTTVTVGLGQAFARIGEKAVVAIREPSLGPVMGLKGGAAGGGFAQVVPMESINLHFTGDLHAITCAHNVLASLVDNALHFREGPPLDPRKTTWKRVLDINDRALRHVMVGLGGDGVPRETGFDITAASEVMAVFCLSRDRADLRARLARIVVGETFDGVPVTAGDLGADGPMAALLDEALAPNLVQTLEGTPALVHGGPFANIAHGTNSLIATRMALRLADYVITEAGFAFDLGAEKFFDIVCRTGDLSPSAVVIVATVRALKLHGGKKLSEIKEIDADAVRRGLANLHAHLDTAQAFGVPAVVAINHFAGDDPAEVEVVQAACAERGVRAVVADVFGHGGAGGEALARAVKEAADGFAGRYTPLYPLEITPEEKIRLIARRAYGAADVHFTADAQKQLARAVEHGFGALPICIAKTEKSLSDDPKVLGRPHGFTLTVREVVVSAGAGFLVAITGEMMRMPGLPRHPQGLALSVDAQGRISGLGK